MKKIVRRKWAKDPSVLHRAMGALQPFLSHELVALQTPGRMAWEAMRTGQGTWDDFNTLAQVVNVALVRAEDIDALAVDVAKRAQDALMAIRSRHDRCGKWGVDHVAMQDLPVCLNLYEQMLELSTPLQMAQAMRNTLARMNAGHLLEARA